MKSTYELKRFKTSRSPDLVGALKLYIEYTEPAVRTDTKEIMYCIDNWNASFKDSFYVVGFYLNNVLIGFSEFAYFHEEKFVIVDYLVIHKNYRKNNTFYQFIDDLKSFLNKENIEYNHIVAEVACYHDNVEPPESSKLLIRLLKMAHFGVLKCNYYVPRVGMNDLESSMKSVMMIYSLNKSKSIRKETFIQIVNTIYHKYYQRWHNIFADEVEKERYDSEITHLKEKIEKNIGRRDLIEINGLSGLFPVTTDFSSDFKTRKILKILTALILFIFSFAAVGLIYTILKNKLGWDSEATSSIITGSAGLTLFLVAVTFERKSNTFSRFFEKIFEKI